MRVIWAQIPRDDLINHMFQSIATIKGERRLVWCGSVGWDMVLCKYPDTHEHWTLTNEEFIEQYGELPETKGEWYEYDEE